MNIGVFVCNFEHKKTQEGLLNLFLNGYKVECILAADPVQLDFYQSKIRITPKELQYTHTHKIADVLKIPYYVVKMYSKYFGTKLISSSIEPPFFKTETTLSISCSLGFSSYILINSDILQM